VSLRIAIAKPDWGIQGGYEFLIAQLVRRLEQRGHDVTVLHPRVDRMGAFAFGEDVRDLLVHDGEYARFLQIVERFAVLDLRRADLVVSAMPGAYALQHPRHLTIFSHHLRRHYDLSDVYVEAGMVDDLAVHARASADVRRIDARYLGATPLILATSQEVAGRLARFNHLTHNVDLFLAGLGFQGEWPEPTDRDAFEHVLCVSRHEFPKRTELFVQAMQHIEHARAVSVGAGGRLGWAQQLAVDFVEGRRDADFPSRQLWCTTVRSPIPMPLEDVGPLRFVGHVDAAELDRLYRRALCVVAPAYLEDYGLTAIEAMAYGKPLVVCKDGGNLANFVEDGVNGFVVEPDGRSIAEAVQRFVDDPALAQKLGAAARETARPYTWERAMRQFDAGIERVMAR
jgi:glycosyltransferase involved in cell wall biosynthesis